MSTGVAPVGRRNGWSTATAALQEQPLCFSFGHISELSSSLTPSRRPCARQPAPSGGRAGPLGGAPPPAWVLVPVAPSCAPGPGVLFPFSAAPNIDSFTRRWLPISD
jgi:hypothetical protein